LEEWERTYKPDDTANKSLWLAEQLPECGQTVQRTLRYLRIQRLKELQRNLHMSTVPIYHIYPIYPPIHLSIYLSNYLQPMHAAEAPERALRELEAPRPQWRIRRGSPQLILLGAHTWW
jgi:hypothetical protein